MHSWYFCLGLKLPTLSLPSVFQADIRDEEALLHAFEGVDCVFHVASHGMSGAEKVSTSHTVPGINTLGSDPGFVPPYPLGLCVH